MNSTCACVTNATVNGSVEKQHRYFMQFSSKDDCFFSSLCSFSFFLCRCRRHCCRCCCHDCNMLVALSLFSTIICLHFATQLFVLASRKLPLTQAWKIWSGCVYGMLLLEHSLFFSPSYFFYIKMKYFVIWSHVLQSQKYTHSHKRNENMVSLFLLWNSQIKMENIAIENFWMEFTLKNKTNAIVLLAKIMKIPFDK